MSHIISADIGTHTQLFSTMTRNRSAASTVWMAPFRNFSQAERADPWNAQSAGLEPYFNSASSETAAFRTASSDGVFTLGSRDSRRREAVLELAVRQSCFWPPQDANRRLGQGYDGYEFIYAYRRAGSLELS